MKRIVKNPEERRGELIASAQQFFYTKGYENTSVGDIVDAIGVAKGTFYYYFESKQAVLEAMVKEIVSQSIALLQKIVADQTLDAIRKWSQALTVVNNFKVEHKDQLLAFARVLQRPENVQLQHRLREESLKMVTPELAKIVYQGAEEGVFSTPYIDEAAEIALTIMESLSNTLTDILLHPENYTEPAAAAARKAAAAEYAIELVLGAPQGSLAIFSAGALDAWFTHIPHQYINTKGDVQ